MAKTTDTEATIESLLEQRSQYEEWLLRLDTSGDKASPAVRDRVRGDYQARLDAVMEQLRSHGAAIAEELERQHASQAAIDRERRSAEEALAEAEVRHSVGEYDEGEWKKLVDQSKKEIEQLRGRLRSIGAEITRLTEIQSLIAAPRSGGAAPAAPAAPAGTPGPRTARPEVVEEAPMVTHVGESFDEPAAPPPASKRAQPEPPAPPGDELAFLKSVSDEEPSRMAGRRPSNPAMAAPTATAQAKPPEPAITPKAGTGVAKTLKCGECGTLNRPTEWYCERCGAELAGV
ncbi:MAG TPA: zinc finger Ran-binding domain-containing protein [Gemmatimonadales bacterium]|nr:zinc finger Ran-binding domain-containing protein [Gemmatimonadales bacterium]